MYGGRTKPVLCLWYQCVIVSWSYPQLLAHLKVNDKASVYQPVTSHPKQTRLQTAMFNFVLFSMHCLFKMEPHFSRVLQDLSPLFLMDKKYSPVFKMVSCWIWPKPWIGCDITSPPVSLQLDWAAFGVMTLPSIGIPLLLWFSSKRKYDSPKAKKNWTLYSPLWN